MILDIELRIIPAFRAKGDTITFETARNKYVVG